MQKDQVISNNGSPATLTRENKKTDHQCYEPQKNHFNYEVYK